MKQRVNATANRASKKSPRAKKPDAAAAPESRRGDSRRGDFRGPGLQIWDLSLRKGFAVSGDVRLAVQADMFNVFNHTNLRFSAQSLNLSGGGFGVLNTAAPPRNVQLGVRLTF